MNFYFENNYTTYQKVLKKFTTAKVPFSLDSYLGSTSKNFLMLPHVIMGLHNLSVLGQIK